LLAGEPLWFTPIDEPTRRGYRFEGSAVIGGLLEDVVVTFVRWRQPKARAANGKRGAGSHRLKGDGVPRQPELEPDPRLPPADGPAAGGADWAA